MTSGSFDSSFGPQADAIVKKYPVPRSAVMPLLHLIQEKERHLGPQAIEWVASKLGLQPINVYEIVTFYPGFKEKPMGRIHLRLCKTLSCMLAGAGQTGKELEKILGCKIGETRSDGEVSIEWVECLAACDQAPAMLIDSKLQPKVTPARIPEILKNAGLKIS